MLKKKNISPAYLLKYNGYCKKQVILLMIPNREGHYLAVKRLSALLRGITTKTNGDFYCLNCLHSFLTKTKIEPRKKVSKKKKRFL